MDDNISTQDMILIDLLVEKELLYLKMKESEKNEKSDVGKEKLNCEPEICYKEYEQPPMVKNEIYYSSENLFI